MVDPDEAIVGLAGSIATGVTFISSSSSTDAYTTSATIRSIASPLAISMETSKVAPPSPCLFEALTKVPMPFGSASLSSRVNLHLEEPPQYFAGMKVPPR